MSIVNCEEFYLEKGDLITDYRYNHLNENFLYRYYPIYSSNNIIFRRIKFLDENNFFGIPH